ncbi:MAG: ester cyclase, partial [Thermoplasmata archaeon]
ICGELLKGFPDLRFELKDTISDEKGVAVEWTLVGTHEGLFMGVQPTNKKIEVKGTTIFRISDHKIISAAEYWNPSLLFNQIKEL